MRRGYDSGLMGENGVFVGVNLGADHCAEHEWGIARLRDAFGMRDTAPDCLGIESRRVRTVPAELRLLAVPGGRVLQFEQWNPERWDERELSIYDGDLATAWDEGSFGIHARGDGADRLVELDKAIRDLDAAIWLGGGGVFQNAGLCIVIVSRLPAEGIAMLRAGDEDRIALRAASDATGIEAELRAAGKRWFALSPKWARDFGGKRETAHPVIYWLNPQEQDANNFGWFTVEQLREWAAGRGPIPKTQEPRARRRA